MSIPQELFKYRNFEKYTILSLLNKGLWIPKPAQLNDPFDNQFKIQSSEISKDEFMKSYETFQHWHLNKYKKNINYNDFDLLFTNDKPNAHLSKKVSDFKLYWNSSSEKMGVLSLSSDPSNITMWSHYADNHQGICIGYDPKKLFVHLPNEAIDWLYPVDYQPQDNITRNAYLLYAMCGMWYSSEAAFDLFFKMACTKTDEWKYESEWRFINPENGGNIFNLNIDAISSITFGLKTSSETKSAISHILRYHNKKTKFFQTIRKNSFIGLERIGLDENSKYFLEQCEQS